MSNSASEAACGFKLGVEELRDLISNFGGDRGESTAETWEVDTILAAGRSSGLFSGSSGMVSRESGRVTLPELLVDAEVGDFKLVDVAGLEIEVVVVRAFDGLMGVMREDVVVVGFFGGADAVPPKVVRLDVSALGCVLAVRKLVAPTVKVLAGRLFSLPSAIVPSSLPLPAAFLTEEVTGLVGGLLMVLPAVRDDSALVREVVGDEGVLAAVLSLEEAVVAFFGSSVGGFAGGLAPVPVLLSILLSRGLHHRCGDQSSFVRVVVMYKQLCRVRTTCRRVNGVTGRSRVVATRAGCLWRTFPILF